MTLTEDLFALTDGVAIPLPPELRNWKVAPNGYLTLDGQELFAMYSENGGLAKHFMHYRWDKEKRQVIAEQVSCDFVMSKENSNGTH